jgi:amino-acid N-acetyltransferase
MSITIRPARPSDVSQITEMVNRFAAQNIMLPRQEEQVRQTINDWLVACDENPLLVQPAVVGCGALMPLSHKLVEIRSLAIHESQQGKGLGGELVLRLVEAARERDYSQVCALTLRENFFVRLGFRVVDRWSISPKVWQACIYCPKFHHCDEVAVVMDLVNGSGMADNEAGRNAGWNSLLRWEAWQPLKLAYRSDPIDYGKDRSNN